MSLFAKNQQLRRVLYVLWIVIAAVGAWGLWQRAETGHRLANYGSYVPWGLWVAAYIFFIGLSAGAFLLSALVFGFGFNKLERLAPYALLTALATLFMALFSIFLDLGHPFRAVNVFLHPNFGSMMTWMVWLYTAYFILIIAESVLAFRPLLANQQEGLRGMIAKLIGSANGYTDEQRERDESRLKILGRLGIPLAISFHGGVGALFATVVARPYWHSALYPILFLTGALVSGGALMLAVALIFGDDMDPAGEAIQMLRKIVVGLLAFDLLLEWAEYSIPMWYNIGPEAALMKEVLFGHYWYVFWVFHFGLGAIIPLILFMRAPKSAPALITGGLLTALTYMAVRLNLVVPALIEPQLKGLENAYIRSRLVFEYFPSAMEWSVLAGITALGAALWYVGYRLVLNRERMA
ncbi:MAG: hypothetical protein D6761_08410 [Candidatus Dadabacteria bacterium]|nr:MAG: hypothetical protein D6761_08410 [Candidatus Dadabacteria bacterium]